MNVRIALAAGLALLALAIAARLSRPPLALVGTNSIVAEREVGAIKEATSFCESDEMLPGGVSAIRLGALAHVGPRVTVTALSGARVIATGTRAAGWTGDFVTVPIEPLPRTVSHAKVCIALGAAVNLVELFGERLPRQGEAPRVSIEYLRPSSRSWWSIAPAVARRMGLGRSPSGTWIAFIPLALMAAVVVLTSWLVLQQLGSRRLGADTPPIAGAQLATCRRPRARSRRGPQVRPRRKRQTSGGGLGQRLRAVLGGVPTAAWGCGAVACLSAASWSIVTPPFQVPDEPSHFAYAQQLAESGTLPTSSSATFSEEEVAALGAVEQAEVHENPTQGTISSAAQQQRLERYLALDLARQGGGGAGVAASEPPLYYALQTVPYHLAAAGNVLDRLALMRLLSALMAGLTALFAFLFLREALPGAPWGWTVGGLGVALFPMLGFMSGAVNPDAMLYAVCAALFYCLARAFRRRLSTQLAVAIGALTAVGLLTKLNFVGLVPGVALALVVLARRAQRSTESPAYRPAALAAAIAASPVCVYALVNLLSGHAGLGQLSVGIDLTSGHGSLPGEISYLWQLYLPRLPGMANDFPGVSASRLWFDRSVGLYGWLDTYFPNWVYTVALVPAGLIAALCARALIAGRVALRERVWELLSYTVMGLGVLALVGADSFLLFPRRSGGYMEPRYLLPMAALFGAALALAARGAGRRWGPPIGTLIVLLILAHDIFSQLLTISRYYG